MWEDILKDAFTQWHGQRVGDRDKDWDRDRDKDKDKDKEGDKKGDRDDSNDWDKTTATTETVITTLNKITSNCQRKTAHIMNMRHQVLSIICFQFSSPHKMNQSYQ